MFQPTYDALIAALLSIGAAGILHFSYRLYRQRQWFKGLPQPPASFLWGHLKVMGEAAAAFPPNCHPQLYYTYIAQKYDLDGVFYLDLWPIAPSFVVATTPELLDQFTVTRAFRQHQLSADFMAPITGRDVIATVNGPVWKQLHNAMAPAFSWSHIRNMTAVISDEVMHFRDTLDQLSKSGEVFSVEETAAKLIFDVIARIVFNFPLNAQTKGSSYLDDLREMVALQEAQLSLNPLVKLRAAIKKRGILARLHPAITAQIRERLALLRREQIVPSRKDPYSILDLMLREELETGSGALKTGNADTIAPKYLDLLITNVKGLLLGGHGTTTDTLCYIYILLSNHPDVIQELREEHSRLFGPDLSSTLETLQNAPQKVQDLEYTAAVIREALRLFPVGFGVREGQEGATVTHNGRDFPVDNGIGIATSSHSIHYNAAYFPEPTKFQPSRFLGPAKAAPLKRFRTFSRGARACLGQNLAMTELQVILLLTARDYDFEYIRSAKWQAPNAKPRVPFTDLDTLYGDAVFQELGLEAKPRGGVMMKVRKASAAQ